MSECNHDFSERESSVATEGYCPICMAADNKRLRELNAELLETLKSIARRLAPGSRNMDEMMREIMFVCDITRAAIAKATGGE